MKRGDLSGAASSGSSLKRTISDLSNNDEEEGSRFSVHLVSQNQALVREMHLYKRKLVESRKELNLMRRKSKEMDGLVSLIRRSWSQLDMDANMLLNDTLGDIPTTTTANTNASTDNSNMVMTTSNNSSNISSENDSFNVYRQYLNAGSDFASYNPTEVENTIITPFTSQIDEWSSTEEINKGKTIIHAKIEESKEKMSGEVLLGEKLDESLLVHASFTLNILEKLCSAIAATSSNKNTNSTNIKQHHHHYQQQQNNTNNEMEVSESNSQSTSATTSNSRTETWALLSDIKSLHTERLLLVDRTVKLAHEIIELKGELHVMEQLKVKAEKTVDKLTEIASETAVTGNITSSSSSSSSSSSAVVGMSGSSGTTENTTAMVIANTNTAHINHNNDAAIAELNKQIKLLEHQLIESESAKSRVEMDLTERFARPIQQIQADAQVSDMRKAMEDLRMQSKQRVSFLFSECSSMQEKVTNLEIALSSVESEASTEITQLVEETETAVKLAKHDQENLKAQLLSAKVELDAAVQLKAQVTNLEQLESTARIQVIKLKEKITQFNLTQDTLNASLLLSRKREEQLENQLAAAIIKNVREYDAIQEEKKLQLKQKQEQQLKEQKEKEEEEEKQRLLKEAEEEKEKIRLLKLMKKEENIEVEGTGTGSDSTDMSVVESVITLTSMGDVIITPIIKNEVQSNYDAVSMNVDTSSVTPSTATAATTAVAITLTVNPAATHDESGEEGEVQESSPMKPISSSLSTSSVGLSSVSLANNNNNSKMDKKKKPSTSSSVISTGVKSTNSTSSGGSNNRNSTATISPQPTSATGTKTPTSTSKSTNTSGNSSSANKKIKENLKPSSSLSSTSTTTSKEHSITTTTPKEPSPTKELSFKEHSLEELEVLVLSMHQRNQEQQNELTDARTNINDLYLEIEAVANEEIKAREQVLELIKQVNESQNMHSGLVEENTRLHDQVSELQRQYTTSLERIDSMENVLKMQDSIILQLRSCEKSLRQEITQVSKSNSMDIKKSFEMDQKTMEMDQKLSFSEHQLNEEKKRNVELQKRCDDLTTSLSTERKQRMELQREMKKKKDKESKLSSSSSSSANSSSTDLTTTSGTGMTGGSGMSGGSTVGNNRDENAAMLDLTLSMLRCSVCRDRFKQVTITRCFHLFCKECIDENLRNRHRKCPACGEKFGQDDVRQIFFSN